MHSRNSGLWTSALERTAALSLHAPGVAPLYGPPVPNLRSQNASTAAGMSSWCGGQAASKTPCSPVGLGTDQRSSVS